MVEAPQQAPLPSPLSRPKAAFNGHTGYFPGPESQGESSGAANVRTTQDYSRLAPIDYGQKEVTEHDARPDWQTELSRIGQYFADIPSLSFSPVPRHGCQDSLNIIPQTHITVHRAELYRQHSTKGQSIPFIVQPRCHFTRPSTPISNTRICKPPTSISRRFGSAYVRPVPEYHIYHRQSNPRAHHQSDKGYRACRFSSTIPR